MTYRHLLWPPVIAGLAACAGIPEDRGVGDINARIEPLAGFTWAAPLAAPPVEVRALLEQPLRPADSVRVALALSEHLRLQYVRLGMAQADLYDALRLSNPSLHLSVLESSEAGAMTQVAAGVAQNLAELLLYLPRRDLAKAELESAKDEVAADVLAFAREVEAAHVNYVSALQVAEMRRIVAGAADVAARLAQRFHDAGNISALELRREEAAASEAEIESIEARAQAAEARRELGLRLGLDPTVEWTVDARLPPPADHEPELRALLALAEAQRLDLAAARRDVTGLEDALGLTRTFRFVGDAHVGWERERETDGSTLRGPNLELELPLFNLGSGKIERARASLDLGRAHAASLALHIRHDVTLAHAKAAAARERVIAFRERQVPQREAIVARMLELQNFMIEGQFELLESKREEYAAWRGYLEALRDYWLARTDLSHAVGGTLPGDLAGADPSIGAVEVVDPPPMDHEGHHGHHSSHGSDGGGEAAEDPHAGHRMPDRDDETDGHGHHDHGDTP